MFVLKKKKLKELLNTWTNLFEVYSPQKVDGQVMLLPFEENGFTLDYVNFAYPVKEYLFKQKESLFSWENDNGFIKIKNPESSQESKKIFFGVRACDAYGIAYMDKFFLEGYKDNLYEKNRESSYIVAMNCVNPGKDCFCCSMETGPFANKGFDILLTPMEDEYLVEVGSKKGEELISVAENLFDIANDNLLNEKDRLYNNVIKEFKISIQCDDIHKVLEDNFDNPLWEELSKDCVGCTGCTNLCPTCTCFNVIEEKKGNNCGVRSRCWDSCQSSSFTRNAGEHNPRNNVSKVRYRLYDKFKYIEEKFNFKGCTGCGRCINVCPASINVVKVINKLAENNDTVKGNDTESVISHNHNNGQSCEEVYTPQIAVIKEIIYEAKNIKRFILQYEDKSLHDKFTFDGQFFEITVFGVGEIAISIPFSPSVKNEFDFCIKKTGKVTRAIHEMKVGDKVGLRGPFGKGFPYEEFKGRDVIIVGSGVGIAPVRTMIARIIENKQDFGKVVVIASAMSYEGLVYKEDLKAWNNVENVRILYALSNPTSEVDAHVGYINDLLPDLGLDWANTSSIICASPRRIKAVAKDLLKLGMKGTDIYTSLETHMRCGIGKCGHCKVGNKYMCIDGPVFNYDEMLTLPPEF